MTRDPSDNTPRPDAFLPDPARPDSPGRGGRCPICGRPTRRELRPFCSRRCRDVDLARWLGGVYCIPGTESDDPEATDPRIRSGNDEDV